MVAENPIAGSELVCREGEARGVLHSGGGVIRASGLFAILAGSAVRLMIECGSG